MVAELKTPEPVRVPVEPEPIEPGEAPSPEAAVRPLVSVAGLVRGVDVELKTAVIGAAVAGDDISMERAFVRSVFAGGGLQLRQGGAGVIVSGGDTTIEKGGAQAIVSAGTINMESAGSALAVARRIRVGHGGLAGRALTPHLEVAEGGRVVFGRSAALALVGGFVSLAALLVYLLRSRVRVVPVSPLAVGQARFASLLRSLRRPG